MLTTFALALVLGCNPPVAPPSEEGTPPEVVVTHPPSPVALPDDVGVDYVVDLERAAVHLVDVTATARATGPGAMLWMMPVWTPGSYLVREYARNVEGVRATDAAGAPLSVRKVTKNRWEVTASAPGPVTVHYTVYARELGVRSSFVDADRAVLAGAATFLTPVDALATRHDVRLVLPEGWPTSQTGLDPHPDGQPHHYVARDFDELVDSPVVAGSPQVHDFEVRGVPHRLVNLGGAGLWDEARSAADVERIVVAETRFWGTVPYDRYVFLNVIVDHGGGGLEHLDSTLLLAARDATGSDERYNKWLGLVSHEFFHTWNVKRLRPEGLGPFDYESEVYTPSLWVAEGLTSYFDDLLLVRAELIEPDEHLSRLSDSIHGLADRPGALVQSLSEASFDAWIKYYRSDENSVNTSVSYYTKGAVVGWLLDVEIRRNSGDRHRLDDVLRTLYARTGERGYTPQDVRAVASELAGVDLGPFFDAYVDGTAPLDYQPALDWLGLRFAPAPEDDDPPGWLGLDVGGGVVRTVVRDTPAWQAGVNVDDEVLGLDDLRWEAGTWDRVRDRYQAGDTATLLVARDGMLRELPVTFATEPAPVWKLTLDPQATTLQRMRRDKWWTGR